MEQEGCLTRGAGFADSVGHWKHTWRGVTEHIFQVQTDF